MAERCLCTSRDATSCDGGGRPPRADVCDCACHGGAEATDALLPGGLVAAARAEGRLAGLQEARDIARRAMERNLALAEEYGREAGEQRRAFAAEDSSLARDLDELICRVSRG